MTDLNNGILGIDISKAKFDVALMVAGKIKKTHVFENAPDGFQTLSSWLLKQGITKVAACMEATGCYGEALATYLYDQGIEVSVVNPAQIKSFSGAQLKRAKTDKADAKLIAQFYQQMQPDHWSPPPLHVRELQALVQRLTALAQMEGQEQNRMQVAPAVIRPSIETVLATIRSEIKTVEELIRDHIGAVTIGVSFAFVFHQTSGQWLDVVSKYRSQGNKKATRRSLFYLLPEAMITSRSRSVHP